jgi:hypothetical protein
MRGVSTPLPRLSETWNASESGGSSVKQNNYKGTLGSKRRRRPPIKGEER